MFNKTDFLYLKKNTFLLAIFLHPNKCVCLALFSLIFSLFSVYNEGGRQATFVALPIKNILTNLDLRQSAHRRTSLATPK